MPCGISSGSSSPSTTVPWETAYAFQRIGDHPLVRTYIEELALLWRSPDPLVRLNVAVLLGKLKDMRTSAVPLERMAMHDADWRVRVAALRALAQLPVDQAPAILDTYRQLFFDERHAIAVTALSSLPTEAVRATGEHPVSAEIVNQLSVIARNEVRNFEPELQGEAAIALAEDLARRCAPGASVAPHGRPARTGAGRDRLRRDRRYGRDGRP